MRILPSFFKEKQRNFFLNFFADPDESMMSSKKTLTCPSCVVTQKKFKGKTFQIFEIEMAFLEGLNSSLAASAAELWSNMC